MTACECFFEVYSKSTLLFLRIPSILQRNIEKRNSHGSKNYGSYSNALYKTNCKCQMPAINRDVLEFLYTECISFSFDFVSVFLLILHIDIRYVNGL